MPASGQDEMRATELRVLGLISRGRPTDEVLQALVDVVEQVDDESLVSVIVLAPGAARADHAAGRRLPAPLVAAIDGQAAEPRSGPCGAAMHDRSRVVVPDLRSEGRWNPLREAALSHGFRACWSTPILDADGAVLGSFGVYHRLPGPPAAHLVDLVDRLVALATVALVRQRDEADLRQSAARFRAVTLATTDAIWDWDIAQDEIWHDESYRTLFGSVAGDALHSMEHWLAHVVEADRERVRESLGAALEGGAEYWEAEYRYLRPDGAVVDVLDCAYILRDPAGRPTRAIGGMADVTERRAEQRQLQERMKELRCLYRVLEVTTDDGATLEQVCREVATAMPDSLVHTHLAVARVVIDDVSATGPGWDEPAVLHVAPVVVDGVTHGALEVGYREVPASSEPFLDEELALFEAVAAHLARMVRQRQMARSLVQAERLRAVGELTGGLAHDFNNLLTVVLGAAELLQSTEDGNVRDLATMVSAAAQRGAELTQRLLAFARKQVLEPQDVDVHALVSEMVPLLRSTLGAHVDLVVAPAHEVSHHAARVDPSQLESAVLNLCLNARDAMRAGGRIMIQVHEREAQPDEVGDDLLPGAYVVVEVADAGEGIPPEHLPRVFEPFFTTKSPGVGTGLGLSMVYGFVSQTRGAVRITSTPGLGTTVRLFLPVATGAPAGQLPSEADAPTRFGPRRAVVLLVEDDPLVCDLIARQVAELGHEVLATASAEEALDLLDERPDVEILLTDVVLRDSASGPELAAEARRRRPELPVVMMSGYSATELAAAPDVELLAKPFRQDELAARLAEVLGPH